MKIAGKMNLTNLYLASLSIGLFWFESGSLVCSNNWYDYGVTFDIWGMWIDFTKPNSHILTLIAFLGQIKRESALEDLERLQVNTELSTGKTPMELAHAGLSSAIEPTVLS